MRDEIIVALGRGGAIDRPLLLSLLPWMREWPVDKPIDLLVEGRLSGRRFGPLLRYTSDDEPVYVRLSTTGRYSVARSLDTAPDQWQDRGAADEPDSLIDAVLAGLELRDASKLAAFTQRPACGMTDVQWVRHRLAHELADSRPALMRVLHDRIASSRSAAIWTSPIGATSAREMVAPRLPPVDPALLQQIAAMTSDEILEAAGLRGWDDRDSVFYASLRANVGPIANGARARASVVTDPAGGEKRVDAPMLLEVLSEVWTRKPRNLEQLAGMLRTTRKRLADLVMKDFIPTARGLDLLWKEDRGPVSLMSPAVLEAMEAMRADDRLPSLLHLFAVALLCRLSFENLCKHIRPCGMTDVGRRLLQPPPRIRNRVDVDLLKRIAGMDRNALVTAGGVAGVARTSGNSPSTMRGHYGSSVLALTTNGKQKLQKAIDPLFQFKPLTAPDFLKILEELWTPGGRTLGDLALQLHFRYPDLEHRVHPDGVPKPLGLDLIHRTQRAIPLELADVGVVKKTLELRNLGWIPTPYHLLVVAFLFNVSFEKLQRRVNVGSGLTEMGKRFMAPRRTDLKLKAQRDLHISLNRLPDPSKPLWLRIDGEFFLEVPVVGKPKVVRLPGTNVGPEPWTQSIVLPAAQATATQARAPSPDLADVLGTLPDATDAMDLSAEDHELMVFAESDAQQQAAPEPDYMHMWVEDLFAAPSDDVAQLVPQEITDSLMELLFQ